MGTAAASKGMLIDLEASVIGGKATLGKRDSISAVASYWWRI